MNYNPKYLGGGLLAGYVLVLVAFPPANILNHILAALGAFLLSLGVWMDGTRVAKAATGGLLVASGIAGGLLGLPPLLAGFIAGSGLTSLLDVGRE